jgi:hypothetical protein
MHRAIFLQPIKRHYFSNTKEEICKIIINLLKKLSFFMALVLISGLPVQAIGDPIASGFPALNVSTNGDTTEY